jgi:hypothetical protein
VLENLPATTLPRLLRRTAVSAVIAGFLGFLVALFVAPPISALGVAIGVGLAVGNLRYLDHQAARVELHGEQSAKAIRRQLGGRTAGRLVSITVVLVVAVWLDAPLGFGILAGLMLYQIVFVINMIRVVTSQESFE